MTDKTVKERVKVLLEFKKSHHYWEEWDRCKIFCPNCGKQTVWEELETYEDQWYACTNCEFYFSMSGQVLPKLDAWAQIPKQLKSGVANKPTTPEGH